MNMNGKLIKRLKEKGIAEGRLAAFVNAFNLLVLGRIVRNSMRQTAPEEAVSLAAALRKKDRNAVVGALKQIYGENLLQGMVNDASENLLETFLHKAA